MYCLLSHHLEGRFQKKPTHPTHKVRKKIKITWSENHFQAKISILAKNYFFPNISRFGRSSSHLDLRNILSVIP